MKLLIVFSFAFLGVFIKAQKFEIVDEENVPIDYVIVYNSAGEALGFSDQAGVVADSVLSKVKMQDSLYLDHNLYYQKVLTKKEIVNQTRIVLTYMDRQLDEITVVAAKPKEEDKYIVLTTYVRSYVLKDSKPMSYMDGIMEYYVPIDEKGKVKGELKEYRVFKSNDAEELDIEFLDLPELGSQSLLTFYDSKLEEVSHNKYKFKSEDSGRYIGNATFTDRAYVNYDWVKNTKKGYFRVKVLGMDITIFQHLKNQELNIKSINEDNISKLQYYSELVKLHIIYKGLTLDNDFQLLSDLQVVRVGYATKKEYKAIKGSGKKLGFSSSEYQDEFWLNYEDLRPLTTFIANKLGNELKELPNAQ